MKIAYRMRDGGAWPSAPARKEHARQCILGASAPPRVCNPRDRWRSRRRRECGGCSGGGELAELLQDGVDLLESGEDLVSHLASGQHDLARDKDEEHDLGLHHPVDEAWEELGFIGRVVRVLVREALEPDGELDIARADHVLDLEVGEARRKIQLLDDPRELARRLPRLLLALCARDDHLARLEDERCCLWVPDPHDDGGEALRVVLGVAGVHRDGLQVEGDAEVARGDDVLEDWSDAGEAGGRLVGGLVGRLGGRVGRHQRGGGRRCASRRPSEHGGH
mmetsp:Transcript_30143/g.99934  ORF Transcript_30143/g.99934 Transcript_30143/m.99934 type:complete len:279 (+) Transcript_30143:348-1184(+)